MNKFNIGDKVQAEIHPKYKDKQFDGVGTITTVVKKKYKFLDNGEIVSTRSRQASENRFY